jgi:hypothetical protein
MLRDFSSSVAMAGGVGWAVMPIASKAEDMVLAVYMSPQETAPGQAAFDRRQFGCIEFMCTKSTHGFKCADDGQVLNLVMNGLDSAVVHKYRWNFETPGRSWA